MIALAHMHGRMGYFPKALRVERVGEVFAYTEVLDLERLRLRALETRQKQNTQRTSEALDRLIRYLAGNYGLKVEREGNVIRFITVNQPDDLQVLLATLYVSSAE